MKTKILVLQDRKSKSKSMILIRNIDNVMCSDLWIYLSISNGTFISVTHEFTDVVEEIYEIIRNQNKDEDEVVLLPVENLKITQTCTVRPNR